MMSWKHKVTPQQALDRLKNQIIVQTQGLADNDMYIEQVVLWFEDGSKLVLAHDQDCCESVWVEDVIGDYKDLIGQPLIDIQEETNNRHPIDVDPNSMDTDEGSFTWTFYKIASTKGWITIRFYGTSNGYYSESAELYLYTQENTNESTH